MKKQLILSLIPIMSLVACSKGSTSKLSVASPIGAPSVALYTRLFDDNTEVNDASNIQTWLSNGEYDVVIAPTNAGVTFITKKNAPYKLAASITFGNFYIASTGNDTDNIMDKDDYVVVFQKNNIPDKLFQHLYGADYNVHYVADNTDAVRALTTGKDESNNNATVDYVMIAQPGLYNVMSQKENVSIYANLQEKYKEKNENADFTQASVFINTRIEKADGEAFLNGLKKDINNLLSKGDKMINKYLDSYSDVQIAAKLGVKTKDQLKAVVKDNLLGLGYKDAFANKAAIDSFLKNLGFGDETSEEIYFK